MARFEWHGPAVVTRSWELIADVLELLYELAAPVGVVHEGATPRDCAVVILSGVPERVQEEVRVDPVAGMREGERISIRLEWGAAREQVHPHRIHLGRCPTPPL